MGEEEDLPKPPQVEPPTDDDDDWSLGDISLEEPYHRRSTAVSMVGPDGNIREPIFKPWTHFTEFIHKGMTWAVVECATIAAKMPEVTIVVVSALAFALVIIGFFTNFELELDFEKVFTPLNTLPAEVS